MRARSHSIEPHHEHVWIIEAARPRVRGIARLLLDGRLQRLQEPWQSQHLARRVLVPRGKDIAASPPRVAYFVPPEMRAVDAPVAHREEDRAALCRGSQSGRRAGGQAHTH